MSTPDEGSGFRIHRDSHVRLPDDGTPEATEPVSAFRWPDAAVVIAMLALFGWLGWLWWG